MMVVGAALGSTGLKDMRRAVPIRTVVYHGKLWLVHMRKDL